MLSDVLVLGLTAYALVYLFRYTDGPGDVFLSLRKLVGFIYVPVLDDDGQQVHIIEEVPTDNFIGKLTGCWWCISVWASLLLTVLWDFHYDVTLWNFIFYWLAPVGVAGFLHQWHE